MKITEYPQVTSIQNNDVFLIDGTRGTKTVPQYRMPYALFDGIPEMHTQIFRGNNLGSALTTAQKTAISNGSFTDLWLGDYWLIGGIKYRIADFNYFMRFGSPSTYINHVVVVPDTELGYSTYSATATATSYYSASIRTALTECLSTIRSAFTDANILSIKHNLITEITAAGGVSYTSNTSKLELMTLRQVFGASEYRSRNARQPQNQFSLFRVAPKYIIDSEPYYLQDLTVDKGAYYVFEDGFFDTTKYPNEDQKSLRPFFALRG